MKAKIQRIVVYVSDTVARASFYRDHFEFEMVGEWTSEWAELSSDGCNIGFHKAYTDSKPVDTPPGSTDNPHKIALLVDSVEESREKLVTAGVQMLNILNFDGWKICNGYDCEGHAFQITNR